MPKGDGAVRRAAAREQREEEIEERKFKKAEEKKLIFGINPLHLFFLLLFSVFFTHGLKYNYELLLFCECVSPHLTLHHPHPPHLSLSLCQGDQGLHSKTTSTSERSTSQLPRRMSWYKSEYRD